jgi:hypothetical protein
VAQGMPALVQVTWGVVKLDLRSRDLGPTKWKISVVPPN